MHSAELYHHLPHPQIGDGAPQGQELQHMDRCLVEGTVSSGLPALKRG